MAYVYRGTVHDLDTPVITEAPVFDPALCGSTRGHKQHRKFNESPCRPCMDAYNTYYRDLNKRRKKGPIFRGFRDDACGTYAGYKRHYKHKVPYCGPCETAGREYRQDCAERRAAA